MTPNQRKALLSFTILLASVFAIHYAAKYHIRHGHPTIPPLDISGVTLTVDTSNWALMRQGKMASYTHDGAPSRPEPFKIHPEDSVWPGSHGEPVSMGEWMRHEEKDPGHPWPYAEGHGPWKSHTVKRDTLPGRYVIKQKVSCILTYCTLETLGHDTNGPDFANMYDNTVNDKPLEYLERVKTEEYNKCFDTMLRILKLTDNGDHGPYTRKEPDTVNVDLGYFPRLSNPMPWIDTHPQGHWNSEGDDIQKLLDSLRKSLTYPLDGSIISGGVYTQDSLVIHHGKNGAQDTIEIVNRPVRHFDPTLFNIQ